MDGWIELTVVNAESNEVDGVAVDGALVDGGVLLLKVVGELRPVVAAVRLGEDAEVAVLVLRELREEGLQQLPHVRGGRDGRRDAVGAI